ncbi:hypothetical protein KF707_15915 [Candidatus Obscuribacterales bacterium]|nr:hypothetical protein [Candidatus Obscuribacterales bacterium]MBX3152081.1 hypothetical protein [Candidatus Obscuribacterales bacterium]
MSITKSPEVELFLKQAHAQDNEKLANDEALKARTARRDSEFFAIARFLHDWIQELIASGENMASFALPEESVHRISVEIRGVELSGVELSSMKYDGSSSDKIHISSGDSLVVLQVGENGSGSVGWTPTDNRKLAGQSFLTSRQIASIMLNEPMDKQIQNCPRR